MLRLLRSNLKFRHLQLLVTLDEVRLVRRAAELMHVSQPALSKALAEIESIVGSALFERRSRGMVPTPAGEVLIRYARESLGALARASTDFQMHVSGAAGSVHVGTMMTSAALVARAVAALKRDSPRTTVQVHEGLMDVLVERLGLGQFDLVVGRLDAVDLPSGFVAEPLHADGVVVVCGPGHALAGREPADPKDLADAAWLLPPPGSSAREHFDRVWRERGLAPPADVVETGSFLSLFMLLRERPAVAILGQSLAHQLRALGLVDIVPLQPVQSGSEIGIVRPRDRSASPATALLLKWLRAGASA